MIAPSQRLDDIASKHLDTLPRTIRALLRGVGVTGQGETARGAALASYMLFESAYTRELIALGEADTQAKREEVRAFFGWGHGAGVQALARQRAPALPPEAQNVARLTSSRS
ncbi:MAG: hypothetical protein U5O44_10415 [Sphaerotilus sp.]|nr:hypothetical protein [Sphaerotilus sp.]MDZ7856597.1 hypothetical protein [Sphaerotilus sp.]